MSAITGVTASTQIIDPKTGYLTRDGFLLFQSFVLAINGTGSSVTVDGIQTLINKAIDGNLNSLGNIDTNSLKSRTGDANSVVTGTAGSPGNVAVWGGNGDVGDGPAAAALALSDDVLRLDGNQPMAGPLILASYLVAEVPAAADWTGGEIYVSNESGGATLAFSDGTDWRRVQDRAIIS